MSFRTRLTGFFVLIVVVPMIAVGFLVFRLIGDSEQGKVDARASGLAVITASVYRRAEARAQVDAQTIARDLTPLLTTAAGRRTLQARVPSLVASQPELARVTVSSGSVVLADAGSRTAIAPGFAILRPGPGVPMTKVSVSELTANAYADELTSPGVGVIVRAGTHTLGSTLSVPSDLRLPTRGQITIRGVGYQAVTQQLAGLEGPTVSVTVLSDLSATATSVQASRVVAAVFIAGFLLLAFSFSVLASRALQGQLGRFLDAARRLGGGDFSSSVPTEGRDEFAALGAEFNSMSSQLEHRLDELGQERARLRESIRRIGQTFASNLDRPALLELALRTAVDAVNADCGRVSVRTIAEDPLAETVRVGSPGDLDRGVYDAEQAALTTGSLGESKAGELAVASVPLGAIENSSRARGLITVGRSHGNFTDADRDVLRSLAAQATLALENVELHHQVQRQAVTDELTGLANHGRFQELLSTEIERVRRYGASVGLIMLDLDNFKEVNDVYGHQQGDLVLKQVARVVRENSRDADTPARYGGEEMVLILPHTELEGAYTIAERVRTAIEDLRIQRLDAQGVLKVTASLGVATLARGGKDTLIAEADNALYEAKRKGKNRTIRAATQTTNVFSGE